MASTPIRVVGVVGVVGAVDRGGGGAGASCAQIDADGARARTLGSPGASATSTPIRVVGVVGAVDRGAGGAGASCGPLAKNRHIPNRTASNHQIVNESGTGKESERPPSRPLAPLAPPPPNPSWTRAKTLETAARGTPRALAWRAYVGGAGLVNEGAQHRNRGTRYIFSQGVVCVDHVARSSVRPLQRLSVCASCGLSKR